MDGAFLDLNSETISNEVQEFWTDIFKVNKFFQQVKKKEMLEKANKEGVKRKKEEKDASDAAEEMPAITVCNKIMDQIKEFKVNVDNFSTTFVFSHFLKSFPVLLLQNLAMFVVSQYKSKY